jgi:hypothetical protein
VQSQRITSIKKNGSSIATGEKRSVTEKKCLVDFSGPQWMASVKKKALFMKV